MLAVLHTGDITMPIHARQMQQNREARRSLDQRADRGTSQAQDQVTLPVTRNRPIVGFPRPLADHDLRGDEGLTPPPKSRPQRRDDAVHRRHGNASLALLELFIGAGIVGILYYGSFFRRLPPGVAPALAAPVLAPIASGSTIGKLLLFFLKAGSLTFGSGLVIVPFLQKGLVQEYGWLDERQFLIAVAVGMISPGPVVITATFVGYLVAGFWGSLVSTIGIFLPSFLLVLVAAPILARHRGNTNVQGFIKGAYAAAIGTILGACVLLGRIAIGDWLTVAIGISSLAVLFRWKVSNPLLITATALVGLIAFPLLQPTWVMVK